MRIGPRNTHPVQNKSMRRINGRLYLFMVSRTTIKVYRANSSDRKPWVLVHSF
jgi:hypothetical protein